MDDLLRFGERKVAQGGAVLIQGIWRAQAQLFLEFGIRRIFQEMQLIDFREKTGQRSHYHDERVTLRVGHEIINTDSQFPSVPEFTFFVYDHLNAFGYSTTIPSA